MINVMISEIEMELAFETKIPKIPEKGDKIGAFFDGQFYVCEIYSFLYVFNKDGVFDKIEINVIAL